MQHPDSDSQVHGKVLPLTRWPGSESKMAAPQREAVVGEKIVTILKEMFESLRVPKAHRAR